MEAHEHAVADARPEGLSRATALPGQLPDCTAAAVTGPLSWLSSPRRLLQDLPVAFCRTHATPSRACCTPGMVATDSVPPGSGRLNGQRQNASSLLYVPNFPSVKETSFLPNTCPPRDGTRMKHVCAAARRLGEEKEPRKQKVSTSRATGLGFTFVVEA